jgi:hypothetical protein
MMLMLIKEEIRRCWESALKNFGDAEKLEKEGNFHEAADKALWAVMLGFETIRKLSEELKDPALKDTALIVIADWVERRMAIDAGKQHSTIKETLEWAFKLLTRLYDAAPLGVLQPLK